MKSTVYPITETRGRGTETDRETFRSSSGGETDMSDRPKMRGDAECDNI